MRVAVRKEHDVSRLQRDLLVERRRLHRARFALDEVKVRESSTGNLHPPRRTEVGTEIHRAHQAQPAQDLADDVHYFFALNFFQFACALVTKDFSCWFHGTFVLNFLPS